MEVHSIAEMGRVLRLDLSNAMLGINNRNLETFKARAALHCIACLSGFEGRLHALDCRLVSWSCTFDVLIWVPTCLLQIHCRKGMFDCAMMLQVDLGNNKLIMSSTSGHEALQRGILVTGESGIFTPEHLSFVQEAGCGAVLVGESLVTDTNPAEAVRRLLA